MFVTYEAQVSGFLNGCRPFIQLDACFLKGPYGGQLLSAVASDGNDQIFPLTVVVAESENNSSWIWFLEKSGDCIRKIYWDGGHI